MIVKSTICHTLTDKPQNSILLDGGSFRVAYCETDHYLFVANIGSDWNK
jgi:hypothetical protein